MKFGKLDFTEVNANPNLLAKPTLAFIAKHNLQQVWVASIDDKLADTAAFCEAYDIGLEVSANCVVLEAKRAEKTWYAACLVLATTRADVNGIVRRELDARKISFAPMDTATSLSSMEYGGITPLGLPNDWQIIVDTRVAEQKQVIIGSGIRGSKLLVDTDIFASLPNVSIKDIVKQAT
jgi:prolyl-tRNA editing enzyme YbaK/EbsC (Cys-tRNA(Pro) deacylase)